MEDQQLSFNTTPESLDLLADILIAAHLAILGQHPEHVDRELSVDEQDQIVTVAGSILVEILRLSEEAEDE